MHAVPETEFPQPWQVSKPLDPFDSVVLQAHLRQVSAGCKASNLCDLVLVQVNGGGLLACFDRSLVCGRVDVWLAIQRVSALSNNRERVKHPQDAQCNQPANIQ